MKFTLLISVQGSAVVCEKIVRGDVQHLKRLLRLNHPQLSRTENLEFFDAHFINCEIVSNLTNASGALTFITKNIIQ